MTSLKNNNLFTLDQDMCLVTATDGNGRLVVVRTTWSSVKQRSTMLNGHCSGSCWWWSVASPSNHSVLNRLSPEAQGSVSSSLMRTFSCLLLMNCTAELFKCHLALSLSTQQTIHTESCGCSAMTCSSSVFRTAWGLTVSWRMGL